MSLSMNTSTQGNNGNASISKTSKDDAFDMMALTSLIDDDIDMMDFFDPEQSFANIPADIEDDALLAELESIDPIDDPFMPSSISSFSMYHSSAAPDNINKTTNGNNNDSSLSHPFNEIETSKLEESMRRSSMTRESIQAFRQQEQQQMFNQSTAGSFNSNGTTSVCYNQSSSSQSPTANTTNQPLRPQTVASCAAFLMGSRPTLTTALEQSRKQLQQYMASINQQGHGMQ